MSKENIKDKKLDELFTHNRSSFRFIAEFIKRYRENAFEAFETEKERASKEQVLMSDDRFVGVRKKGLYDKKIVAQYSLSVLYDLCLTFKYSGIKLSDVVLNVPCESFPAVILTESTPFEVLIAPLALEEID